VKATERLLIDQERLVKELSFGCETDDVPAGQKEPLDTICAGLGEHQPPVTRAALDEALKAKKIDLVRRHSTMCSVFASPRHRDLRQLGAAVNDLEAAVESADETGEMGRLNAATYHRFAGILLYLPALASAESDSQPSQEKALTQLTRALEHFHIALRSWPSAQQAANVLATMLALLGIKAPGVSFDATKELYRALLAAGPQGYRDRLVDVVDGDYDLVLLRGVAKKSKVPKEKPKT
jgi:hypothetical protein